MNEIKQKEIEEMAKVMYGYICKDNPCEKCDYNQGSKILAPYCEYYLKAKDLYNAGYRNCKDKVVLSKEVYEKLCHLAYFGYDDVKEQTRKETARDFYHEIMSYIGANQKFWIVDDEHITIINVDELFDFVIELAKQYGVEIKE